MSGPWAEGIEVAEALMGSELFDYQLRFAGWVHGWVDTTTIRACLYYRTGAGKTDTAMLGLHMAENDRPANRVLIIAPLSTHAQWEEAATKWNQNAVIVTHEKFRQKTFRVEKSVPVICDEFHKLGGARGVGWKKFDRMCEGIQAPVIILSATPQYNDAERVYCVAHAMDPKNHRGGFLEFLAMNCTTKVNPYAQTPIVTGFIRFKDAEEFLATRPYVFYVPDTPDITIVDSTLTMELPPYFTKYGLNPSQDRIMASDMERRKSEEKLLYLSLTQSFPRTKVWEWIMLRPAIRDGRRIVLFCASKTIANAIAERCTEARIPISVITGNVNKETRAIELERFKSGEATILIGTAAMATGINGLDKVCDDMALVHDTDDNTLRKQLIGRIKARGKDSDNSNKRVDRLTVVPTVYS